MERTVLESMLSDETAFAEASVLEPDDFSLESHRRMFSRMLSMKEQGLGVDPSTLMSDLSWTGEFSSIGGAAYLADLISGLPRKFSPQSYVQILRTETARRKLINLCDVARSRADGGEDLK